MADGQTFLLLAGIGTSSCHFGRQGALRSRTLKTHNRAGLAFRMAAQSASPSPQIAYGAFFRCRGARLGPDQAMVATTHKIARAFYHMPKYRVPCHDLSAEEYEKRANERELANLRKKAARLSMVLVEQPAQAIPA